MKKLFYMILIFICCCGFVFIGGKPHEQPCSLCSGTYDGCWTGEYSGDTDKMCHNSGASSADATDTVAGVIVAGGAINGNYGALLDAGDEHIRWDATSTTIDDAGTIVMTLVIPESPTGSTCLAEIYSEANNKIYVGYNHTENDFRVYHKGQGNTGTHLGTDNPSSGQHTVRFTWNDTTNYLCTKIDAGAWDCTLDTDLTNFANAPQDYAVGDDQVALWSIYDSWKVDDVYFIEGYQQ